MADERGLSGGVQVTLLFPLALGVLLLALQWALVSWADASALAAAQDGARVAATHRGADADGIATAVEASGNGSLSEVQVGISRGSGEVVVTVTGRAASFVPGWSPAISRAARVPVERVTTS